MKCPYCSTENRDDSETCHHCGKDISMLRLIVGKARHHYNVALEHAERQRYPEALTELEHALELDRSFVPAHVVMGTVYAKMEKFDEAERCWNTALALDPHVQKAHHYLCKTEPARETAPLRRKLRVAVSAALIVAVVFLLATLWQLRPTADREQTDRVLEAIDQNDYAAALDTARELAQSAHRRETRLAAQLLENAIAEKYETTGLTMLQFLLENKPIEARRLYRTLKEKGPPPEPYREHLERLDQRAVDQAVALLNTWERRFEAGELTYADLEEHTRDLRSAFDETRLLKRIDTLLASARHTLVTQTLDLVPASTRSTSETLIWIARLEDLAERAPESRDRISSATERLIAANLAQLRQRVDRALANDDLAATESILDEIALLESHASPEALETLAETAREGMRRLAAERLRSRLESATTAEIPQVDDWIESFERKTSSTVESRDELRETVSRTRRRLAAEMLRWCTVRDRRFEQRQITEEEARWTVERAEFTLRYVVGQDWRYVRDNMTFYAGVAWLVLGETDKALRWFERLEQNYPESPYVPLMRRYRQEIEDRPSGTPSEVE